jgi:hypothetical protein
MEVEKQEYIHIKMHKNEAEKLVLLLEQIDSTMSNLPNWAKAQSIEIIRKIKSVGL